MSGKLRFELASPEPGDPVALDTFAALTEHLSGLLGELDRARSGGRAVRWVITDLEIGSAVLEVTGQPEADHVADVAPLIVRDAVIGLDVLRMGGQPDFRGRALDHAVEIAKVLQRDGARITVASNGTSIELGPEIQLEEAVVYEDFGEDAFASVEGALETVYLHDRAHFDIWDVLYRRKVSCDFDRALLPAVREGLGERVRVQGRVAFDREGHPERMSEVSQIQVLREVSLPRPADLLGIAPGMTQGLGAAEWVRRIRDAET
jgi:hypothetical protein